MSKQANAQPAPVAPAGLWERIPQNELGLSGWAIRRQTAAGSRTTVCAVLGTDGFWEVFSVGPDGTQTQSVEFDELAEVLQQAEAGLLALGWPPAVVSGQQAVAGAPS